MSRLEEFVRGTGQRTTKRLVVLKDVPTNHEEKKEFVEGMEPKSRFAVMKDVPTKYRMEGFVRDTEPRGIFVTMKDVPT